MIALHSIVLVVLGVPEYVESKQGLGMEVHPVSINTTQTLVKDIR